MLSCPMAQPDREDLDMRLIAAALASLILGASLAHANQARQVRDARSQCAKSARNRAHEAVARKHRGALAIRDLARQDGMLQWHEHADAVRAESAPLDVPRTGPLAGATSSRGGRIVGIGGSGDSRNDE